MKKLFLVLAAAFAMVACQTDINEVGVAGGEVDVTFEVGTPTRAYSDGTTATVLQYAVYEGETELTALTRSVKGNNPDSINISKTVSFKLVTGNEYTVIFWAAAPNAPYTVDFANKEMTVDYTAATTLSNDENRDAFFKKHTFTVKGAQTETIELRRPFAQLNIGTNDYAAATQAGYTPEYSAVTVKNIYSTLNLWDATVDGGTEVTFNYAEIAKGEAFPVTGYQYLAMNYLLVPADKEVVDVVFGYKEETGDAKTRTVGSVPVQRNYRTNIYGQLLTSDVDINVVIKPEYYEPAHEADALFLAAAVGGEVTLTEDVELESTLLVQNNMTINLNGKTITAKSQDGYAIINEGGTTLRITNDTNTRTSNNGGVINGVVYTGENSTTIVDGGTFNALENASYIFLNSGGNLTINNATINHCGTYPIYSYNEGNKLVINNATINGTFGCINAYGVNGEVVINGGTFQMTGVQGNTSHIAYFSSKVKAIINGGTFEKIGDISMSETGGGGVCVNGGANLTINGGNFAGDHADVYNYGGIYSILGGTYKFKPSNVADGYVAKQNSENLWVVYKGAATVEALAEAISNGDEVVVLTEDITLAEALTIENTTTTIDLNGKTLTAAETDGIVANAGANVTISGAGKVISNGAPIRAIGGKVVVEGGEFTQTGAFNTAISTYRYSVDSREGGEIIIKGGEFKTNNGMINVSANSSVVVNGGSFLFDNNTKGTRHFAVVEGNITVNDGVFKGIADGGAGGCFFCGWGGTVTVNGGKFTSLWTSGSKNNIWESYYGGSIEVNGGIFNHNGGIKAQVTENTDAATKDAYPYMAK